ncbi:MAG: hypothetical protein ACOC5M_02370 [Chloroflexota bacterium]
MDPMPMNLATVLNLGSDRPGPCVSIYTRLSGAGPDVEQDQTRLENLARQTRDKLVAAGLRAEDARELLAPVAHVAGAGGQWRKRGSGLALFVGPKESRTLGLADPVADAVFVGRRFNTRPLLPALEEAYPVYVLALSQGSTRLLRADAGGLEEVEGPPGMPTSIDEVTRLEDPERHLESHSTGTGGVERGPSGGHGPQIMHGQGAYKDAREDWLDEFTRQVERAVTEWLQGQGSPPLMLAGVKDVASAFRRQSRYSNLVRTGVSGNPDRIASDEILKGARVVAGALADAERRRAKSRLVERQGGGVARHVNKVLPAAHEGRVLELFLAEGAEVTGRFHPESKTVDETPSSALETDDLLDLAAHYTLRAGGKVHVMPLEDMPEDPASGPAQALLRY